MDLVDGALEGLRQTHDTPMAAFRQVLVAAHMAAWSEREDAATSSGLLDRARALLADVKERFLDQTDKVGSGLETLVAASDKLVNDYEAKRNASVNAAGQYLERFSRGWTRTKAEEQELHTIVGPLQYVVEQPVVSDGAVWAKQNSLVLMWNEVALRHLERLLQMERRLHPPPGQQPSADALSVVREIAMNAKPELDGDINRLQGQLQAAQRALNEFKARAAADIGGREQQLHRAEYWIKHSSLLVPGGTPGYAPSR